MPLPAGPIAIQVNWEDSNEWPMWEQAHANYLSTFPTVEIERWAFRGTLRTSTCRVQALDPACAVRSWKMDSALAPNVKLGRRLRVLVQDDDASTWYPHFFGYITSYEPDPEDPAPLLATVTAQDALAMIAPMEIALPPSDRPFVYKADDPDHSALVLLLKAAGLWGTPKVSLDPVGDIKIPEVWGDGTATFASWLGDLCVRAECSVSAEPYYAQTADDPDFVLHWYQRKHPQPADWHWSAVPGDLASGARIEWNGEQP